MRLEHVILDELQTVPVRCGLDTLTAERVRDSGLVTVTPTHDQEWNLLPTGLVGAIQVGDWLIEVKPKSKVGLGQLLFLLGYARNPGFRPMNVAGVEEPDLFSSLAESFARQAESALQLGVLHGYRTLEVAAPTVRGRIRVGDQIARRPGMLLPLEVTYDDFTNDIIENQILRTAIKRLLLLPRLRDEARVRLAHLDAKLGGVKLLHVGLPVPNWTESRLNERYVPAIRLAEIIIQNMSAEAGLGTYRVASFVVNMATVFEDFVTTALSEALTQFPGHTIPQYPAFLDEDSTLPSSQRIRMFVDLVHEVAGEPSMIFDAKYKVATASGTYPNADYYQMLAYCTALKLPRAWLVYAGTGIQRTRKILHSEVVVMEYPVDISQSPEQLLISIQKLAVQAASPASTP